MRNFIFWLTIAIALGGCASIQAGKEQLGKENYPSLGKSAVSETLAPETTEKVSQEETSKAAFQERSLAIRRKMAARDLDKLDAWWRREHIGDPHKYLLPVILARLSLPELYDRQKSWDVLWRLEQERPDLYHFRSLFDIRIFFEFRNALPENLLASYRSMVAKPRVIEWREGGTENHLFMQRVSGLALMDGSGWTVEYPDIASTNEAWLRSQINKFLTIGQGEFNSSTYYGYSIGSLLNLYDFASTPELRQLAKAALDWLAVNMALRLSWGTVGGAESRGFDRGTWDSGLSAIAWIWWGSGSADSAAPPNQNIQEIVERMSPKHAKLALVAALSGYRPPVPLKILAQKELPLPFLAKASHPAYYSYRENSNLWETFYITEDYSLGTLLEPACSYQVKGTICAQYATYKLVVRDPKGLRNAVVSLGGNYHSPMATGSSPADRYLQGRSAVVFQQILSQQDREAGLPPSSSLVLPSRYGQPQRYGDWYIWRIEQTWLAARPWADEISSKIIGKNDGKNDSDYQALVAEGNKTAWIVDAARVADYPDLENFVLALDRTEVNDRLWETGGAISYKSIEGDLLAMTYAPYNTVGKRAVGKRAVGNAAAGNATIDGRERILNDWPVLNSPYVRQELGSGVLEVALPDGTVWRLRATLTEPKWEIRN